MSQKETKSSQAAMGQKSTSVQRKPVDKHCFICKSNEDPLLQCITCGRYCDKICAWLEDQDLLSDKLAINWQCHECKRAAQLSTDMDLDSSSAASFGSLFNETPTKKGTPSTKSSEKSTKKSDTKKSATTEKTISKHNSGTPKRPPSPRVVITDIKKRSESASPSKRSKKSTNASAQTEIKDLSSASSQARQHDSGTQTVAGPGGMQFSSSNLPDDLQAALHTIQIHLDDVHLLRTRNNELVEENKNLKEHANSKDETSWELKEYNENLQAQVEQLKAERDELLEKLRKIRRLSGTDMPDISA